MLATLTPLRERAQELRAEPGRVREILRAAAAKARALARATLARVRQCMGLLEGAEA
jgi:tryptophanyl-tRNA synthetase